VGLSAIGIGIAGVAVSGLVLTMSVVSGPSGSDAGKGSAAMKDRAAFTEAEWKKTLTPEQYRILRRKGTERAFTGKYHDHHDAGVYTCAGCGQELFSSTEKFNSGTGWPSFRNPAGEGRVLEQGDTSFGKKRTEVLCAGCRGHLGHVFGDGPDPGGLRYCINSAALDFKEQAAAQAEPAASLATATFGAGCFWCSEAVFQSLDGVKSVKVGYMGGSVKSPTYKQVCSGRTGHAEVAQISYDPMKISYEELLAVFWKTHDPTSLNRQGADAGTQYRPVIFSHSDEQNKTAEKSKEAVRQNFSKPIVTEIAPAGRFYEAEPGHQDYYNKNPNAPYCRMVIAPKLKKIK